MTDSVDTGQLWHWVDRLTRDRRQRLVRQVKGQKKGRVEYVPVPSLLTQLAEAIASTDSGGGHGKASPGSRAPIDLQIEDLIADMSARTRQGLLGLGAQPRVLVAAPLTGPGRATPLIAEVHIDEDGHEHRIPIVDPGRAGTMIEAAARATVRRDTGRFRHDLATDLRQLPALIVGTRQQALVDEWTDRYRLWVARAETILTADDENVELRGIRGHPCPSCGEQHVTREEPSTDPRALFGVERFHDPALVISFRDGQVQHITCRACDTGWWRGDDVDQLGQEIRATTAPTPAEQPANRPTIDYGPDTNAGGRLRGRRDDWWPWPDRGGSAA